jgi:predicted metal-dependent HD superfamily phosphohydrolase
MTDLDERWPLAELTEVRAELQAAYDDPSRGYHDALHLTEVLARLDELASAGVGFDPTVTALAAWFHDAVYDGERDAEERSAVWAEEALAATPYAAEVARLVRLTETHDPGVGDLAGQALCDGDLAILASPRERYDAYVAGVRQEYAHLSDADFVAGRSAVLHDLAGRDRLFHTSYARERWEPAARDNLQRELAGLPDDVTCRGRRGDPRGRA